MTKGFYIFYSVISIDILDFIVAEALYIHGENRKSLMAARRLSRVVAISFTRGWDGLVTLEDLKRCGNHVVDLRMYYPLKITANG